MSQDLKRRVDADNVLLRERTRSLARDRNASEAELVAQARDANTAVLKEGRLRKEAIDRRDRDA